MHVGICTNFSEGLDPRAGGLDMRLAWWSQLAEPIIDPDHVVKLTAVDTAEPHFLLSMCQTWSETLSQRMPAALEMTDAAAHQQVTSINMIA